MFNKIVAAVLAVAAVLSGCASNSGPTFNTQQIRTSSGQSAFRAECYGLFENGSACMQAVKKACGDQPYTVLQNVEGTQAPGDARSVIFTCGAPAPVAESKPQAVVAVAAAPVAAPSRKVVTLDGKTNFAFDSAQLSSRRRLRRRATASRARLHRMRRATAAQKTVAWKSC